MTITAITRYEASCNVCRQDLDDQDSGDRLDFPDAESATEYADQCGWTVRGDELVCTRQDGKHEAATQDRPNQERP